MLLVKLAFQGYSKQIIELYFIWIHTMAIMISEAWEGPYLTEIKSNPVSHTLSDWMLNIVGHCEGWGVSLNRQILNPGRDPWIILMS